jgi:hypothetical protein
MTTNEIITELLKYDGWKIDYNRFTYYVEYENKEKIKHCCVERRHNLSTQHLLYAYLTDLNILHPVAVKVISELIDNPCHDDISDITNRFDNIRNTLTKLPINGEYIALATATVEAIVYLKSHKP